LPILGEIFENFTLFEVKKNFLEILEILINFGIKFKLSENFQIGHTEFLMLGRDPYNF